jgi:hypothetical protein
VPDVSSTASGNCSAGIGGDSDLGCINLEIGGTTPLWPSHPCETTDLATRHDNFALHEAKPDRSPVCAGFDSGRLRVR